jgi:ComEC/Rec2-related protein
MIGMAAGLAALIGVGLGWWGAVAVALATVAALTWRRSRPDVAAAIICLAALVGAWRGATTPAIGEDAATAEVGSAAIVVSPPQSTGQRQYFSIVPQSTLIEDEPDRICVTAAAVPRVQLGDVLSLSGSPRAAADLAGVQRASLAARGCAASWFAPSLRVLGSTAGFLRAVAELKFRIDEVLRRAAPGDAGVLLSGFVTGDDTALSLERRAAFRRTGTTHLTAVSGSNLALLVGILATVGAATIGRYRVAWQGITIAGVWGYALLTGLQPPALRAALVASAAILAFRVGRRPDFPTLILLAAGAMVLMEPRQLESLGFRLSVVSALALAVVLPGILRGDRVAPAVAAVAAAATAQVATLPVLLPVFGSVSMVSLPANVLIAPLAALAMPIAAFAGIVGLISMPLAEVLAAPAQLTAAISLEIVDHLSADSGAVAFGVPPAEATAAFALTAIGVVSILSGEAARLLRRLRQNHIAPE